MSPIVSLYVYALIISVSGVSHVEFMSSIPTHLLGQSAIGCGDVNGDSYPDLCLTAPGEGSIYILFGGITYSWTSSPPSSSSPSNFLSSLPSRVDVDNMTAVRGCRLNVPSLSLHSQLRSGDFNQDGVSDLLFTAGGVSRNGESNNTPTIYILWGGSDISADIELASLSADRVWRLSLSLSLAVEDLEIASVGDTNGDHVDDFLIGVPKDGVATVIYGGVTLRTVFHLPPTATTGLTINASNVPFFGISSCGVDINGDGFTDLVFTTPARSLQPPPSLASASLYLIYGKQQSDDTTGQFNLEELTVSSGRIITIPQVLTDEGSENGVILSVTNGGDVNGDGINDIALGIPTSGRVWIVLGSAVPNQELSTSIDTLESTDRAFFIEGPENEVRFGGTLNGGFDFNRDGRSEVVIGSPGSDIAYVIYGSPALTSTSILQLRNNDQAFTVLGVPLSNFSTGLCSGDFNGDGYDDLFLSAPNLQGGSVMVVLGRATKIYEDLLDTNLENGCDGLFPPLILGLSPGTCRPPLLRGDSCAFQCGVGYLKTGSLDLICLGSQLTTGLNGTCLPVDCGEFPLPLYANPLTTPCAHNYPQTCYFTCQPGATPTTNLTAQCQANGDWSRNEGCTDINACEAFPCSLSSIPDGSLCIDLPPPALNNANGRLCTCMDGYALVSGSCQNVNACLAAPCPSPHHHCQDLPPPALYGPEGRICQCTEGYVAYGDQCMERSVCAAFPCDLGGATCYDLHNDQFSKAGRRCECNSGYVGNGETCNACPEDTYATSWGECLSCSIHGFSPPKSQNCTCLSGYTGDGVLCLPKNEISSLLEPCAEVTLTINLDLRGSNNNYNNNDYNAISMENSLRVDLANALLLPLSQIIIISLSSQGPNRTLVVLDFVPDPKDGRSVIDYLSSLQQQLQDPNSPLQKGVVTAYLDKNFFVYKIIDAHAPPPQLFPVFETSVFIVIMVLVACAVIAVYILNRVFYPKAQSLRLASFLFIVISWTCNLVFTIFLNHNLQDEDLFWINYLAIGAFCSSFLFNIIAVGKFLRNELLVNQAFGNWLRDGFFITNFAWWMSGMNAKNILILRSGILGRSMFSAPVSHRLEDNAVYASLISHFLLDFMLLICEAKMSFYLETFNTVAAVALLFNMLNLAFSFLQFVEYFVISARARIDGVPAVMRERKSSLSVVEQGALLYSGSPAHRLRSSSTTLDISLSGHSLTPKRGRPLYSHNHNYVKIRSPSLSASSPHRPPSPRNFSLAPPSPTLSPVLSSHEEETKRWFNSERAGRGSLSSTLPVDIPVEPTSLSIDTGNPLETLTPPPVSEEGSSILSSSTASSNSIAGSSSCSSGFESASSPEIPD